jgi:hypothetical protein
MAPHTLLPTHKAVASFAHRLHHHRLRCVTVEQGEMASTGAGSVVTNPSDQVKAAGSMLLYK